MLASFAKFYIVPANPFVARALCARAMGCRHASAPIYRKVILNIDRYQPFFLTQLQNSLQVILLCLNESTPVQPDSEPPLRTAARKYHNLKSNAAMMQMQALSDIAALAEQILLEAAETGLPDSARAYLEELTRRIGQEAARSPETGPLFAPSDWEGFMQDLRAILRQKDPGK